MKIVLSVWGRNTLQDIFRNGAGAKARSVHANHLHLCRTQQALLAVHAPCLLLELHRSASHSLYYGGNVQFIIQSDRSRIVNAAALDDKYHAVGLKQIMLM